MINYCQDAKIPPIYLFEASDFVVKFRKDIYNREYLNSLGLNERQIKAVLFTKENGKITNSDYQQLNNISARTAARDLEYLVDNGIFKMKGERKGVFYELTNGVYGV